METSLPSSLRRLRLCDWTERFRSCWPTELSDLQISHDGQRFLDVELIPTATELLSVPWIDRDSELQLTTFWAPPYVPMFDEWDEPVDPMELMREVGSMKRVTA